MIYLHHCPHCSLMRSPAANTTCRWCLDEGVPPIVAKVTFTFNGSDCTFTPAAYPSEFTRAISFHVEREPGVK